MLRILLLLIIIAGVAGYFTRPNAEAFAEPARAAIGDVAQEQVDSGHVLEAGQSGLEHVGVNTGDGEKFKDYYVFTTYSLPDASNPTITCYGAFTKVLTCQRVGGGDSSGG